MNLKLKLAKTKKSILNKRFKILQLMFLEEVGSY